MKKKIIKLAVIRSDKESFCPFGLKIPFGCKNAGELVSRMAPIDSMGEESSEEEMAEIAQANNRLLMWMLSEEAGGQCPFARNIFTDKGKVECSWESDGAGQALRGSPFYYKHFSGIGIDGLYSYPLGYYADSGIDRSFYQGMYSIESPGAYENKGIIKDSKDLNEEKD